MYYTNQKFFPTSIVFEGRDETIKFVQTCILWSVYYITSFILTWNVSENALVQRACQ